MTLPASPPLSMSQVWAEFGAPAGTPTSAFLRGGPWVPNTAQNAAVPTTLPIRITQLCGAAKTIALLVSAADTTGNSWPGSNAIFGSSTGNATGGTPPYNYTWSRVSGDTFTIDTPNTAFTNFRRAGNPPQFTSASGVYRITVGDALGASAFDDITVTDNRL